MPGSVPPRWPGCVSPTGLGARRAAHLSSGVPQGALTVQSSGTMCLARSSSPQTFGVSFVLLQPPRVLLLPFLLKESITP